MPDQDGDKPEHGGPPGGEAPGDSLRSFLKRGEAFIEEILAENERLRLRVVQLESKLEEGLTPVPAPVAANELRSIFEQLQREHEQLKARLEEVAQETEQYKERYQQIEEENDRLVNLFVSTYQLHSTLDFNELVKVILEILLNFVGAGRFALLIVDAPSESLKAIEAYGVRVGDVPSMLLGEEPAKSLMASPKPTVVDAVTGDWRFDRPVVWIPLRLAGQPVGALAIYSYLKQKREVSAIDYELFSLLSDHAGAVLESARLFASESDVLNRFEAYRELMKRAEEGNA